MGRKKITVMVKPKDTKGTLRRLLSYLGVHKFTIMMVMILSLLANVLVLIGPSLAGKAINQTAKGAGQVDFDTVWYYVRWMFLVYIGSSLLTIINNRIMVKVSRQVARTLRQDTFDKLMRLPVSYFDKHQTGDIISRVSYDIDVIGSSLATDVIQILTSITSVIGSMVMMLIISPLLSIVILFTLPLSILYTKYMRKKTQALYSKRSAFYGKMNGFVEEMFTGQKTIQAYAYEKGISTQFESINQEAADAFYHAEYYGSSIGPTMGMINNLSLSLIAMLSSIFYMMGSVSIGQISSFILYSRKFSGPINGIANIINEIFSAIAAAERVFRLLDQKQESSNQMAGTPLTHVIGKVEMKGVHFGYEADSTILNNLNLSVPPGSLTAIVGPTGAGKTTIINLLMRFYDIDAGQILVDGNEIRNYTLSSLRKSYAMVLQDSWVFQGTIFENIAYGKPDATMEEVISAAKSAHIHSYIMRLPKKYQTIIRADGNNISKGQKQLLTIARAILYDANMLIMDEATSNVDTNTERLVQASMKKLMQGKTSFVIAHRLSTIQNADQILVIDKGNVIEKGTHLELMALKGFYYQLYAAQFE